MLGKLKKLFSRSSLNHKWLRPEASVVVTFNSEGIRCSQPNRKVESISWDKLDAVLLETTDDGPIGTDIYWLLLSKDMTCGCLIPQGATGDKELLGKMQKRLLNFDNEMLTNAMGSTSNQRFVIWERKIP